MAIFSFMKRQQVLDLSAQSPLRPLIKGWIKDSAFQSRLISDDAFRYFRMLDNELSLLLNSRSMELLVTSPTAGDGRTTASLIVAMLSGAYVDDIQTVYIDASDSRAHLMNILNLDPSRPGFYNFLDGSAVMEEVLQISPLPNFAVIAGGALQGDRMLFDKERFAALCQQLKGRYQRIIIDAPSIETHREVLAMVKLIRNVILVVRCCRTPRSRATLALRDLEEVGSNVLGAILIERAFPLPGSRQRN